MTRGSNDRPFTASCQRKHISQPKRSRLIRHHSRRSDAHGHVKCAGSLIRGAGPQAAFRSALICARPLRDRRLRGRSRQASWCVRVWRASDLLVSGRARLVRPVLLVSNGRTRDRLPNRCSDEHKRSHERHFRYHISTPVFVDAKVRLNQGVRIGLNTGYSRGPYLRSPMYLVPRDRSWRHSRKKNLYSM
jgi:hypothetical protein